MDSDKDWVKARNDIKKYKDMQKSLEKQNKQASIMFVLSALVVIISSYFAFRQPVSLVFTVLVPMGIFVYFTQWGIPPIVSFICILIVCVSSLVWVNSKVPIFGERYDNSVEYQKLIVQNKEIENKNQIIMVKVRDLVRPQLKDPKSAEFFNEIVKNEGASIIVCGSVRAKNGFGGMVNLKYVSKGTAQTTFLEENVKDFESVWGQFCY